MSPSRAPPGDAINRCRDAVDSIQAATSHKYSRDRAELVHLLGSPHIQVSDDFWDYVTHPFFRQTNSRVFLCHHNTRGYEKDEISVNQTINNLRGFWMKTKNDLLHFSCVLPRYLLFCFSFFAVFFLVLCEKKTTSRVVHKNLIYCVCLEENT